MSTPIAIEKSRFLLKHDKWVSADTTQYTPGSPACPAPHWGRLQPSRYFFQACKLKVKMRPRGNLLPDWPADWTNQSLRESTNRLLEDVFVDVPGKHGRGRENGRVGRGHHGCTDGAQTQEGHPLPEEQSGEDRLIVEVYTRAWVSSAPRP